LFLFVIYVVNIWLELLLAYNRSRHGRDHMVVGFITTYVISAI